ncbi:guanine nucleotide-binding protein G(f) subunit alpha [Wyeomyia smithii]|uniref:guanine nucleotide-binding protein G(f) subunit alpha n=1 Tax=Wyeomyia smithii TaxID=174621 RepID=UPI002467CA1C|nr:guanine nucleotide-binding protein G(f) subunit alpha [Wyeomyia smithii]XP_055533695.1 guanine nucleotide-binding protein G(f) subunit alpha [Wyeomyia smithii]XP_055533696.1 guanine nucleotide-binding protein G(f) subunit alpha [Wyeomyia smithii]XP_055533697.1 guanine nucleotide-binding protein G(f) subunit alpha [Wyeomyia smithii]
MLLKDCFRRSSQAIIRKKQLEKRITQINEKFHTSVKILLLGAGESGKTTIIKQMKILHEQNGFSFDERLDKLHDIIENIHESIYELVRHVILMNLQFDSKENHWCAQDILKIGKQAPWHLSMEYVQRVRTLWADNGVRKCFKRSNEFQLIDSAKYFLDRIEIISMPGYIPSNVDILNCRKTTNGIQEVRFRIPMSKSFGGGYQEFRIFDVGGQRSHRTKWMQVFEGIEAVLFMIACGSFDQTLREDPSKNRLAEAFELFRGVWHNRFLSETGIIVFLNKQDILKQKIEAGKSIEDYFPEYNQYKENADSDICDEYTRARTFIKSMLVDITNEPPRRTSHLIKRKRSCYYHYTIATDTNNIRMVFNDVHNIILARNLQNIDVI